MNIKITSGKVIISDPWYINTAEMGAVLSVSNGVYEINVTTVKVAGLGAGVYNKELVGLAKGRSGSGLKWERAGSIDVESGAAGFFDSNVSSGMSEDEFEEWYDDAIPDMKGLTSLFGGRGCASATSIGDGGYNVFVAKEGNRIVGFKIVFLSDIDIKYYNTPTLWSRDGLLVYHTSNLSAPLYAVPKDKMRSLSLIGIEKNGVFGVIDFDANELKGDGDKINTELAKFIVPKSGVIAKLFRLSEDRHDVSVPSGSFIFTDKKGVEYVYGNIDRLLDRGSRLDGTSLSYIKFDAPAGTYSMAIDYDEGRIVAIRVSKTN